MFQNAIKMFQNLSSAPSQRAKPKQPRKSQATTLPLTESEALNLYSCRVLNDDPAYELMHRLVSGRIQKAPRSLKAYCFRDRNNKGTTSPYQEILHRRIALRSSKIRRHLIRLLEETSGVNRSSELSLHLYLARRAQGLRLAQELEDEVELEQLCDGIAGLADEAGSDDTLEAAQKTEWSSDVDGVDEKYIFYEDMSDEDEEHSDDDNDGDDEDEEEEKVIELDVQMSA